MQPKDVLILALDKIDLGAAMTFIDKTAGRVAGIKVHGLIDRVGTTMLGFMLAVRNLNAGNAIAIFADLKLKDTPDTIEDRASIAKQGGFKWLSVHASGGRAMMERAVAHGPEIVAITALTSLAPKEVEEIYGMPPLVVANRFARLAYASGVRHLVCSALEVGELARNTDLTGMKFIVPGTRSAGVAMGSQKRSATPTEALKDGANFLVIGSQVTQAADPLDALKRLEDEIRPVLESRK